jgi:hypothetical protein
MNYNFEEFRNDHVWILSTMIHSPWNSTKFRKSLKVIYPKSRAPKHNFNEFPDSYVWIMSRIIPTFLNSQFMQIIKRITVYIATNIVFFTQIKNTKGRRRTMHELDKFEKVLAKVINLLKSTECTIVS